MKVTVFERLQCDIFYFMHITGLKVEQYDILYYYYIRAIVGG